jgi:glyoxalase-like protein
MPALDHVFVCCSVGGEEASVLARLGLVEGTSNTHPGQGTASRRFFFTNAYLELMWVADANEARGPLAAPTRLWERWSRRAVGACPFALVLRPGGGDGREPPFAAWAYHPLYLPPDLAIHVAEGTPLGEPELFYLAFARRPDQVSVQPLAHRLPLREVTHVSVVLTGSEPLSPAAQAVERAGLVAFSRGDAPLMTLVFDGGAAGGRADLRPDLPLVLRW